MRSKTKVRLFSILAVLLVSLMCPRIAELSIAQTAGLRFAVSFPESSNKDPLDGRLLLLISTDSAREPRFQISEDLTTQQVFGIDVEGFKPGQEAIVAADAFGYPVRSLAQVPRGEYTVQALLHRYETFKRSDGHNVKLPMDRGEGQQWNRAPGNFYSTPQKITIDPQKSDTIKVLLDKVIPPIVLPKDTKYIKHVKMQSKLLSEFWGRPMYLGANILLPEGFDAHPNARYPLVIFHGHFPADFGGFRETPPDPNLKPEYSDRFKLEGYNKIVQEQAHQFYKEWTGPNFPRLIIIEIQHANPYYDDSYAVNSANLGPYGDAITYELVPFIEKQFRGIGKGWARFMYGGSTGGWEALAAQIFYPDEYNGAWGACPDPIDFRAYTVVNIYDHKNAYRADSQWKQTPRPGKRNYLGELAATIEEMNHMELALGTKSRSGGQWDIWEAVYSPVGKDGYPKPIWNKLTGEIDHAVAAHWRENYDLVHILKRDWSKLGPKLAGKLHIYVGEADNYFLNDAVYLAEEFLKTTKNPHYDGEVDYEPRAEHCLEWRPHQAQRDLTTPLPSVLCAQDRGSNFEKRPTGSRLNELAILDTSFSEHQCLISSNCSFSEAALRLLRKRSPEVSKGMKNSALLFVVFWSLSLPCAQVGDDPFTAASAARLALSQPSNGSNMHSTPQRMIPRRTEQRSQILFDDFNYSKHREMLKHGWIIRSVPGWPGVPGATWAIEGVSFLSDPDVRGNRILRMVSSTAGTSASTRQTQICHQRKFLEGTYAARVRFSDQPISGPGGDQLVESFYTISPLKAPMDPDYSELDWEYLPNGGWGITGPTLYQTTWESFIPEPNWKMDNVSHNTRGGAAGWHTLVTQVGNGEVKYFLDGKLQAEHGGKFYPESLMSINFNLWFIKDGLTKEQAERRYHEDIDWVFHEAGTLLTPEEIEAKVASMRRKSIKFQDTVRPPVPALTSPCDF